MAATAQVRPPHVDATIAELNIGHYLVGEAVFVGLETAVKRMRDAGAILDAHATDLACVLVDPLPHRLPVGLHHQLTL